MASPSTLSRGLAALLEAGVAAGLTPGAQLEVGDARGPVCALHAGHLWAAPQAGEVAPHTPSALHIPPPEVDGQTRFDLASVTKPLAVGLLMKRALTLGCARLDMTLGEALGAAPAAIGGLPAEKAALRLDDLLAHRAGLAAWLPLFEQMPVAARGQVAGRDWVRAATLRHPLEATPGTRERYSDLGYLLLAWALESLLGGRFDQLFAQEVAQPLGLTRTGFVARGWGDAALTDAVCTEDVGWRGGVVRGEVHDDNTAAMGGVSGHAGLFSTAAEVGVIARALLSLDARADSADSADSARWIAPQWVRRCWSREGMLAGAHHLLGWDSPSGDVSGAGFLATRAQTVGHLGFTGTSLWIDRARRGYVVLLTSRVYPTRDAPRIRAFRPLVHDTAWALLDAL
jgi:serine-type D-Ala-D-Ala carboxypeptidase